MASPDVTFAREPHCKDAVALVRHRISELPVARSVPGILDVRIAAGGG